MMDYAKMKQKPNACLFFQSQTEIKLTSLPVETAVHIAFAAMNEVDCGIDSFSLMALVMDEVVR